MEDRRIVVACEEVTEGWRCHVRVEVRPATEHEVFVDAATASRLAPDGDMVELVTDTFRFLLEREPASSIMRQFDLPVVGRYFPEWEAEMSRRTRGERGD